LADSKEEIKKATNTRNAENFNHKMQITNLENSFKVLDASISELTALQKTIRDRKAK
jgi:hypothetical protein